MAKRFIDTGLFEDPWFMGLKKDAKILWIYLITKCDHAGIYEKNESLCKFQTGIDNFNETLKQLTNRCLTVNERYIFMPKFLNYQYPNFPNSEVRAQYSAIERLKKLDLIQTDENGLITLSKGLVNSYGHGTGNEPDSGNDGKGGKGGKTWRNDFEIYLTGLREAYKAILEDIEFMETQEKYYPTVNIKLSLEKVCKYYWATEEGWKKKKDSKSVNLDWKRTLAKSLSYSTNKVYKENTTSRPKHPATIHDNTMVYEKF